MQPVTVQPAERLRHPVIKNRFAMGRMPVGTMHSYGLCSEYTDLAELLLHPLLQSDYIVLSAVFSSSNSDSYCLIAFDNSCSRFLFSHIFEYFLL